jgi:hypothetical protein
MWPAAQSATLAHEDEEIIDPRNLSWEDRIAYEEVCERGFVLKRLTWPVASAVLRRP